MIELINRQCSFTVQCSNFDFYSTTYRKYTVCQVFRNHQIFELNSQQGQAFSGNIHMSHRWRKIEGLPGVLRKDTQFGIVLCVFYEAETDWLGADTHRQIPSSYSSRICPCHLNMEKENSN